MRLRGESVDELTGMVQAVRKRATAVPIDSDGLIDTCGTGGDGLGTFNVSTVTDLLDFRKGAPDAELRK